MDRVLIVNDSRFESLVLRDILSQLGYYVSITDEYEAEEAVRDFLPDVVFINSVMKETFGDQLVERIKKYHPEALCILTSSSEIKRNRLRSRKIDAIVRTPVEKNELEGILQRLNRNENSSEDSEFEASKIKSAMKKWEGKLKQ